MPHFKEDSDKRESIQREATKAIAGSEGLAYVWEKATRMKSLYSTVQDPEGVQELCSIKGWEHDREG